MKEYTKEELVSELQRAEEEIIPLTSDAFEEHPSYPAKSTVSKYFGSWSNACEVAGVESGMVTTKSIITDIKKLYESGEIENSEDFSKHPDTPAINTVYRYFDTWRDAVDEAGVSAYTHYTDEDIIEAIENFEDEYGYVSAYKFSADKKYPSAKTAIYKFGSWNNAVEKSDAEPNEIGVAGSEEYTGDTAEMFGESWNSSREKALRRDGYECTECGNTENLVVHHDKMRKCYRNSETFDVDDSNKLENLLTLCESCHKLVHYDGLQIDNAVSSLRPRVV